MVQTEFWPLFQALQPSKLAADVTSLPPSLNPNPFKNYLVRTDVSKNDRQRTTLHPAKLRTLFPMVWVFPEPTSIGRNIKYTAHPAKRFAVCLLRMLHDEGITFRPRPLGRCEKPNTSFGTSIDVAFLKSWISLGDLERPWILVQPRCPEMHPRLVWYWAPRAKLSHQAAKNKNAPGGANARKHDLTIASSVRCITESALKLLCFVYTIR
jgi:hypothetical protein